MEIMCEARLPRPRKTASSFGKMLMNQRIILIPNSLDKTKECLGTLLENIGRRLSESIICGEVGASDVAMHQTYHFGSTLW